MAGFLAALPLIGPILDSVFNGIDKISTTDEERLKFKTEMMTVIMPVITLLIEAQKSFDTMQTQLQLAALQSSDRFIRWSRPAMSWLTFLFWGYCVVTANPQAEYAFYAFGLIGGLWSASRGGEKIVDKWTTRVNGNGK